MHGFDALTPVEETLSTLDTLVKSGKVRYIACSNFSGWHLMKSLSISERYGWARYVGHQVYYSLIGREYEWELMPLALDQKVGALIWSPLGWGRLTGKIGRNRPIPEVSRLHKTAELGPQVENEYLYKVVDAIDEVAKETGKTVPQIALNWLLQRPTVSNVIIGARNEEQLRQNLGLRRLESHQRTSRQTRRRQRHPTHLPLLAPAPIRQPQPHPRVRLPGVYPDSCRASDPFKTLSLYHTPALWHFTLDLSIPLYKARCIHCDAPVAKINVTGDRLFCIVKHLRERD